MVVRQENVMAMEWRRMSKHQWSASDDLSPDVQNILRDPAASFWIKQALQTALDRDPVDAANDAGVLAEVLSQRCSALLSDTAKLPNEDSVDVVSEPLPMPSCHVCGTRMEPVCPRCGATTKPTAAATGPRK